MSLLRSTGLACLVALLGCGIGLRSATAQIDLPPRSFDEVVAKAQADGTPILLEIYRPSCPYCQRMRETVYTDSTVRAYLSRHFLHARLNSATRAGTHEYANRTFSSAELAMAFGTRGVPNTVFFEPDGSPIVRQPGFIGRSTFLKMIRYVGSGAYQKQAFESFSASD